jgi:hypothetical protein
VAFSVPCSPRVRSERRAAVVLPIKYEAEISVAALEFIMAQK